MESAAYAFSHMANEAKARELKKARLRQDLLALKLSVMVRQDVIMIASWSAEARGSLGGRRYSYVSEVSVDS